MADKTIALTVKVNSDTGQLEVVSSKLQQTGDAAQKTEGQLKKLSGGAGDLLRAFLPFATATGILAFFGKAVQAAEEENEALRRLKGNLEASGVAWESNRAAIEKWAAAIQSSTRFSDTQAFEALDKFVRVTGSLSQAQNAAKLSMDLAVRSGKDLVTTEGMIVDLLNGNQRALIAVNREFGAFTGGATDAQGALDNLKISLTGASEAEDSFTKSINQTKNAFGDFQETVGRTLIPALTPLLNLVTLLLKGFEQMGTVIAGAAASFVSFAMNTSTALGKLARGDFDGVRKALKNMNTELKAIEDETVTMIQETAARGTETVVQHTNERLVAKKKASDEEKKIVEERANDIAKLEQLETDLNLKLQSLSADTYAKKKALIDAELDAEIKAINKSKASEEQKIKTIEALKRRATQQHTNLYTDQAQFDRDTALQTAGIAIEALQTINNMGELKSKHDARRAKLLLALEKAIAIARIWGQYAAQPWLAGAMTALTVAQFAAQSKAIDRAVSDSASAATSYDAGAGTTITVGDGIGGGSGGEVVGGVSSGGGGGGGGSIVSAGGGGGGGGNIIHVGGVVVNFSSDHVDLKDVEVVARRLGEEVLRRTTEGVQLAIAINTVGGQNAGVAR